LFAPRRERHALGAVQSLLDIATEAVPLVATESAMMLS
jgi:hypothetical protein